MKLGFEWCKRQKKGLKLAHPREDLRETFLGKARSALNMLGCALEKNEIDWIITTSYYAKYFALYALFARCGIKSEIHNCTLLGMKRFFVDTKRINKKLYNDINESKGLRVRMQYYSHKQIDKKHILHLASTAEEFVRFFEKYSHTMQKKDIAAIRRQLTHS